MTLRSEGKRIHARFAAFPGAEEIASRQAVVGAMRLVRWKRPRRVLEVGTGIGTLTEAMLTVDPTIDLVCIEDHEWCREQFTIHLAGKSYSLYRGISEVPDGPPFDIAVIDGGDVTEAYFSNLAKGGAVFIEGWRDKQQAAFEQATSRPYARAYLFSLRDRLARRKSGFSLYVLEPSPTFRLASRVLNLRDRVGYWVKRLVPAQTMSHLRNPR